VTHNPSYTGGAGGAKGTGGTATSGNAGNQGQKGAIIVVTKGMDANVRSAQLGNHSNYARIIDIDG